MKHIFDMDNTLVYTDEANNEAYNTALEKMGMVPLRGEMRITREIVLNAYPMLTAEEIKRIVETKKSCYCVEKTYVNEELLQYVRGRERENCFIWSCANRERAFSLMDYHGMDGLFSNIYFSPKADICREYKEMIRYFDIENEDITVYEDTDGYIKQLRGIGVRTVDVKCWKDPMLHP